MMDINQHIPQVTSLIFFLGTGLAYISRAPEDQVCRHLIAAEISVI